MHRRAEACRVCRGTKLTRFLELGDQPLANSFLTPQQAAEGKEPKFPLDVYVCEGCWHAQLLDVVSPEVMFSHYLYFSTTTRSTPAHFAEYAGEVVDRHTVPGDLVVEIGSNDGVLLSCLKGSGRRFVGIDPAKNVAETALARGVPTLTAFFNASTARLVADSLGQAKVVISNNVIGHIDDLHSVTDGISALLGPEGVWIWEVPYLVDLIERNEFDTVYHEHISYFALHPARRLLEQAGLDLVDIKHFPNHHGGTIRIYARHRREGVKPSQEVERFLAREKALGLDTLSPYLALGKRVEELRARLGSMLRELKADGKRIVGYGAPAKGNTLLNYCGIGPEILDYCLDTTPVKQGLVTPGTHIPVVHPKEFAGDPPDVALMLAWNYEREILEKERAYRDAGGRFIVPIPMPRLV